uniref:ComEA protein n=1 Tax=Candidatus Kentrum sp. DK TaxID=2126562 RepID=A0A450SBX4_9GAMM|nr:MAG: comEA protein [Candidatus Kentron sp. DK]
MNTIKNLLFALLLIIPGLLLASDPVDINTATREELMTLNGIGKVKAQAIIDYRATNGPFGSLEGLDEVTGIGEKTIEANRDKMVVTDVEPPMLQHDTHESGDDEPESDDDASPEDETN